MSTTIIGSTGYPKGSRHDWLNHLLHNQTLLTRLVIFIIISLFLTASSEISYNSEECPENLICVVIGQFGIGEEFLTKNITAAMTTELQKLLQTTEHKYFLVENTSRFIDPNDFGFAHNQVKDFAKQKGAQLVLWGGIIGEGEERQLHVELSSFIDIGESTKIRPTRVHTFFSDQIYIRIPCSRCTTLDENAVEHLQILSHITAGWAHYLKDWPEQAGQEFLTALECSGEQLEPVLIMRTQVQCLAKHPIQNLVPLYYYIGKTFALQGDYPNAIYFLRKAHQLAPREPSILIGIGQAYQSWLLEHRAPVLEEFNLARELLYKLQIEAKGDQQAWIEYDLALIAELLDDFDTAQSHFQNALELLENRQQSYEILLGLARVQQKMGKLEATKHVLNQATKIAPNSPWAYLALAQLPQSNQEQIQMALHRAHEIAPDEPLVDVTWAELCKSWQDYDCAVQAYQGALEKRPEWGWLHSKAGEFYIPNDPILPYQSWDKANLHFDLVTDTLRPNDPWAHERLAYVLLNQKIYNEAITHYLHAINLANPDFVPTRLYCNLSLAQEKLGSIEDAARNRKLCNST